MARTAPPGTPRGRAERASSLPSPRHGRAPPPSGPGRKTTHARWSISASSRRRNCGPPPPLPNGPHTAGRFINIWQETDMAKKASRASTLAAKGDMHVSEHLGTPTDLKANATRDITAGMNGLLADVFALYLKTKNFHWHMSGRHFRDYHLLLDEQGDQLFAMTDEIAERARKIGGTTLHSISDISAHQRLADNNNDVVSPEDML